MKKIRKGPILMALGLALLLAAGAWAWYNSYLESRAGETAAVVTDQIKLEMQTVSDGDGGPLVLPNPETGEAEEDEEELLEVDGVQYLGVLSIPALGLELPVAADWSYPQLKKSPCRYVGKVKDEDLVLMAHNYRSHFGYLDQLPEGSEVVFETAGGDTMRYKVALVETLQPTAIQEMTAADYPLTLFTCTYGGRTRVTVRCSWAV